WGHANGSHHGCIHGPVHGAETDEGGAHGVGGACAVLPGRRQRGHRRGDAATGPRLHRSLPGLDGSELCDDRGRPFDRAASDRGRCALLALGARFDAPARGQGHQGADRPPEACHRRSVTDRRKIVIATGNAGKLREYRELLAETGLELVAFDSEVEEVGETFGEMAPEEKRLYSHRANAVRALLASGALERLSD